MEARLTRLETKADNMGREIWILEGALKKLFVLFLLGFVCVPGQAWALPDEQIQMMVKADPRFAFVEQTLINTWKSTPKNFKDKHREYYVSWIKTDRDKNAAIHMRNGLSFIDAYTYETALFNNTLRSLLPRERQKKTRYIDLRRLTASTQQVQSNQPLVVPQANQKEQTSEAKDAEWVKQFYQFDPHANRVTGDIAYYSLIAFSHDDEKTLVGLKAWPKSELQALSLLLDMGFEGSRHYQDFDSRPMFFLRAARHFTSTVRDMAGLATYAEVISGRVGGSTQESHGAAEYGTYIFYPEEAAAPRVIGFEHETVGLNYTEVFDCKDRLLRLHMKDNLWVGKIEYLGECEKK